MGVQDRSGCPTRAHDSRHLQRSGVFWPVVEAWRVDRLSMIGQGRGDRETGWPFVPSVHSIGRGRVTPTYRFKNGRRLCSVLLVGTIIGGLSLPAHAQE